MHIPTSWRARQPCWSGAGSSWSRKASPWFFPILGTQSLPCGATAHVGAGVFSFTPPPPSQWLPLSHMPGKWTPSACPWQWPRSWTQRGLVVNYTVGQRTHTPWLWPDMFKVHMRCQDISDLCLLNVLRPWEKRNPEELGILNPFRKWPSLAYLVFFFFSLQWTERLTVSTTKRTAKFWELQSHFWLT